MAAGSGCFAQPDHRTVLVLFAFQTLLMMSFAVISRYRMNVEPFLYAYAAVGAMGVWGWLRRRLGIFYTRGLSEFLRATLFVKHAGGRQL
jgi:hypothetical protein